MFIWLFHKSIVTVMPILFAIWLIAFGIIRIIEGKKSEERKGTLIGIGVVALLVGVTMIISQWMAAMDMIGIGAFAIIYGFVLLLNNIIEPQKELSDAQIAQSENVEFREFEQRLKSDDKK
ncbi:MAG: DUF308 domain-containing protein [Christensenellaceae bacterium]